MNVGETIRVVVELPQDDPAFEKLRVECQRIEETRKKAVGRYTARRDMPHFQGGEIHAHCPLPGGREASWTLSGKRVHPNKFPADGKIPKDAKAAVAKVLNVDVSLLEAFVAFDPVEGGEVFVLTKRSGVKRLVDALLSE